MSKGASAAVRSAFALLAAVITAAAQADAVAIEQATATVSHLHAGLLQADRQEPDASAAQRFQAFAPLVDSTHDLPYMSRLALGGNWDKLSALEQERFSAAFRRLSILNYADRFRDTAGVTFRVDQALDMRGNRVAINTILSAPGEAPVRLDYVLHTVPAGWRIINIVADGVSDLALQRAQYQQIMTTTGIEALLRRLEQRIAELERK